MCKRLSQRSSLLRRRAFADSAPGALLAQAELADQGRVALGVLVLQVREEALAAIHHAQQAAAAVVVLGVRLEVRGEFVDAGGEKRDLHFGAARVARAASIGLDDAGRVDVSHRWFSLFEV